MGGGSWEVGDGDGDGVCVERFSSWQVGPRREAFWVVA